MERIDRWGVGVWRGASLIMWCMVSSLCCLILQEIEESLPCCAVASALPADRLPAGCSVSAIAKRSHFGQPWITHSRTLCRARPRSYSLALSLLPQHVFHDQSLDILWREIWRCESIRRLAPAKDASRRYRQAYRVRVIAAAETRIAVGGKGSHRSQAPAIRRRHLCASAFPNLPLSTYGTPGKLILFDAA